jgi:hypothetical protein
MENIMPAGPWNYLELVKLVLSLVTPIGLAVLGVYINHATKRFEHLQWRSQKLIEKRLSIYDDIAPELNDLLCYFTYVGRWRDHDPRDIVLKKRDLDKKIHLAAPLFSEDFFGACTKFLELCFETYTGWGNDARLRTKISRRQQAQSGKWQNDWDELFSGNVAELDILRAAYSEIMSIFARDIGVNASFVLPLPGAPPFNIE